MISKYELRYCVWSFYGKYEDYDFNSIDSSDKIKNDSNFGYLGSHRNLAGFGPRVFSVKHFKDLPYDLICFVSGD